ncbi:unnamed protein product [Plutella xylostella]|uniref:(diamondback moth) hypothetical protein n=1 Tax=Plutella xylostella TaxID=51655 RepID=A0A8S4FB99_PLUXY|nr:unnamed protein product [Plutella xylostella]
MALAIEYVLTSPPPPAYPSPCGAQFRCSSGQCLQWRRVCDQTRDCDSDEGPACHTLIHMRGFWHRSQKKLRKWYETRLTDGVGNRLCPYFAPPPPAYPSSCGSQFRCSSGQCLQWRRVCDQTRDCDSDEGPACLTACDNHNCSYSCQSTPSGPVCQCPAGMTPAGGLCTDIDECRDDVCSHVSALTAPAGGLCTDIDECRDDVCSHVCHNVPGTFYCSCFTGYANR